MAWVMTFLTLGPPGAPPRCDILPIFNFSMQQPAQIGYTDIDAQKSVYFNEPPCFVLVQFSKYPSQICVERAIYCALQQMHQIHQSINQSISTVLQLQLLVRTNNPLIENILQQNRTTWSIRSKIQQKQFLANG